MCECCRWRRSDEEEEEEEAAFCFCIFSRSEMNANRRIGCCKTDGCKFLFQFEKKKRDGKKCALLRSDKWMDGWMDARLMGRGNDTANKHEAFCVRTSKAKPTIIDDVCGAPSLTHSLAQSFTQCEVFPNDIHIRISRLFSLKS